MKGMVMMLISLSAFATGKHIRGFEKPRQQKQQENLSNTEKKARSLGWEKDQRPFKPIKTQPEKIKQPSSGQ